MTQEHERSMVAIYVCHDDNEAAIIVSVLADGGVEALVNSDVAHTVLPVLAGVAGEVRVLVDEDKAERALQVIEDHKNSASDADDAES